MNKLKIIYEPTGRAKEYAPLALNIYKGCTHGCKYCYNTRWNGEDYFEGPNPKKKLLAHVYKDARALAEAKDDREILLSFVGDVYQPGEKLHNLTRDTIEILIEHELRFAILTKAGYLATRDFHMLADYHKCKFGISLMCVSDMVRMEWEPGAAPAKERLKALAIANGMGIETFISIEPVIDPQEAMGVVLASYSYTDFYKVGKINHNPGLEDKHDWVAFREAIIETLEKVGAKYYIKKSLSEL